MEKYKISGSTLKIIAMITMVIDHVCYAILRYYAPFAKDGEYRYIYEILRYISRISFPIVAFLLAEGFYHTSNRKKYFIRLVIFSLVSELPFNLAFYHTLWHPEYQNVFPDLLLGFIALLGVYELRKLYYSDKFSKFVQTTAERYVFYIAAVVFVVALCMMVAELLKVDYGAEGVFMIVIFYMLREKPVVATLIGCLALNTDSEIEITSFLAIIPIYLYNGKRGLKMKYIFYLFYPIHLFILYVIYKLINMKY